VQWRSYEDDGVFFNEGGAEGEVHSPAPGASRLPLRDMASAMWLSFDRTLTGFAEATVRRKGLAIDNQAAVAGAVAEYLQAVHKRTPDYLRLPFRVLTLLFDASSYLATGKPFHRLDGAGRVARIEAWERSRLEVCRRLMEMYGSLALFCLYSELYGQDYEYGRTHERSLC
jgi:hypothetical protein